MSKGDLTYQSNYRAGVRILSNHDVANGNLTEVGFFDIYPSNDNADFNGSWSNYPYFDSGILITTGIDEGLFVLRPFGFVAMAANTNLEASSGSQITTTLFASVLSSTTISITLSQTGLPTNTATFSTNPITPTGTSELTVDTSTLAGEGSYPFTINATDGNHTSSIEMTLTVQAAAPSAVSIQALAVERATSVIWIPASLSLAILGGMVSWRHVCRLRRL